MNETAGNAGRARADIRLEHLEDHIREIKNIAEKANDNYSIIKSDMASLKTEVRIIMGLVLTVVGGLIAIVLTQVVLP
jgi:hypothetical protein